MFPITHSLENLLTAIQEEGLTNVTWEATSIEEVREMLCTELDLCEGTHFIVHRQPSDSETYAILGFYNDRTFHFGVRIR